MQDARVVHRAEYVNVQDKNNEVQAGDVEGKEKDDEMQAEDVEGKEKDDEMQAGDVEGKEKDDEMQAGESKLLKFEELLYKETSITTKHLRGKLCSSSPKLIMYV